MKWNQTKRKIQQIALALEFSWSTGHYAVDWKNAQKRWFKFQQMNCIHHVFSYSFIGNYSFFNLEISKNSCEIYKFYLINCIFGENYSMLETKWGNMEFDNNHCFLFHDSKNTMVLTDNAVSHFWWSIHDCCNKW